jgi:hypothetical protein
MVQLSLRIREEKRGERGRVCVLVAQNLEEFGACLKGVNTRENSETRLGISLT